MARIFDITDCPVCTGTGCAENGTAMYNSQIYPVIKQCKNCRGKGRIGVERKEESDDDNVA
jgi:DnaJ-class molecular chaperone